MSRTDRRTGNPNGRPPALSKPLIRRDDGTVETVADRIIAHVRAGNYIEEAAGAAGVSKQAVYNYLRRGAEAQAHIAAGKPLTQLTHHQRECATFVDAVASADAVCTARDVALTAQIAQGVQRTIVTEKVDVATGNVLERTTRTESAEPDGAMLRWRLERRKPHKFGRLNRVELTGMDGGPIIVQPTDPEDVRTRLMETLDRIGARLAQPDDALDVQVIDVASQEALPAGSNGHAGTPAS
jgi:hypothetical protein